MEWRNPRSGELSVEALEAETAETLPARTLMSLFSTSPATTAMPAMPSDLSTGPVDYTKFMQFDPMNS